MSAPVGIALCNPLNMRPTAPSFEGTLGTVTTSAGDFIKFQSNSFGFRAAARNIISYNDRLQLNTVRGIINRWAPPADHNDTSAYVATVCKTTGWGADDPIAPKSYEDCFKLLHAMTIQEQGSFDLYFKEWELTDGLRRAGISDVPVTPLHKRLTAIGGTVAGVSSAAPAIQSALADAAPNLLAIPSPSLHTVYHLLALAGGALAIYGSIQLARKQGV